MAILEIFVEARWPAGRQRKVTINMLLAIGHAAHEQAARWKMKRRELKERARLRKAARRGE